MAGAIRALDVGNPPRVSLWASPGIMESPCMPSAHALKSSAKRRGTEIHQRHRYRCGPACGGCAGVLSSVSGRRFPCESRGSQRRRSPSLTVQHHPAKIRSESGCDYSPAIRVQQHAFCAGQESPGRRKREASFSSPEDAILKKMEFVRAGGSDKHLRDITGVLKTSGSEIDTAYIDRWATTLGLAEIWQAILDRMRGR